MSKAFELIKESVPDQDKANELMEKLFASASPETVFAKPVQVGDYTIITASEFRIGMGYGFGSGGGLAAADEEGEGEEGAAQEGGFGGGGGGGGATLGRPVAAIEIGPQGVRVEPIVDVTKIVVAFVSMLLGSLAMFRRAKRAR